METIFLLHGAIGASDQLGQLTTALGQAANVRAIDFPWHGGRKGEGDFSIAGFSKVVADEIANSGNEPVHIFGYSMGGFVGMYLAKHHPDKVRKLVTLATKFHWDPGIAEKESRMLVPEKILEKLPAFAGVLEKRHRETDWKELLPKTAGMLKDMGNENPLPPAEYHAIQTPCMLMLGDRDKMVSLGETVSAYQALPQAQLAVLPNTPHPIEQIDPGLVSYMVRRFLGV